MSFLQRTSRNITASQARGLPYFAVDQSLFFFALSGQLRQLLPMLLEGYIGRATERNETQPCSARPNFAESSGLPSTSVMLLK